MTRYLRERTLFGPLIDRVPSPDLGLCVVIPAKDEGGNLIASLESLAHCEPPDIAVEVTVVINTSESDLPDTVAANRKDAETVRQWAAERNQAALSFHLLEAHDLPRKHAGVGLARKIGMDEACRRLESVGCPEGVIACFDADSSCDPNYLSALCSHFSGNPKCQAASVYFEHPLEGEEFPSDVYEAIADYELHLRTYINAQRYAGFPHAVQTIGSSMAVRCNAYQDQNGMNRRQAGEDFYFLHKFTPLGQVRELHTTRVIPSPRRSHRVPFGTGKAVGDLLDSGGSCLTYSPESFQDLRHFLESVGRGEYDPEGYPRSVQSFLSTLPFRNRIDEIEANVNSLDAFQTRFFRWFNAFLVMKFLHHARDHHHPDVPVTEAARWLLAETTGESVEETSSCSLLARWRAIDRAR